MNDNLTFEEEEIVHENSALDFPIKNPVLRALLYAFSTAVLLGLPVLNHFMGSVE